MNEESIDDVTKVVTCSCDHMTSFGVLMTVYDRDLPPTSPIVVPAATYALVSVALVCFALTFIVFCLMRGIDSNANSIHINLALVLFVANLVFIAAVDRPSRAA